MFENFVYFWTTGRRKPTFDGRVVETLARNTKFANFAGLDFTHFTTVRDQTLQFY